MTEFEDHEEQCEQCREHPFALCRIGTKLLMDNHIEMAVEELHGSE